MEYLNKIELKGRVGNVKISTIAQTNVVKFSLVTENVSTTQDGTPLIETTWFSCTAFQNDKVNIEAVKTNAYLHIVGRVKMLRYMDQNGVERTFWEVVCNSLSELEK